MRHLQRRSSTKGAFESEAASVFLLTKNYLRGRARRRDCRDQLSPRERDRHVGYFAVVHDATAGSQGWQGESHA